jgi:hypothetical protein
LVGPYPGKIAALAIRLERSEESGEKMRIRSIGAFALLCALIVPISADRATAQSKEKPPQFTYVSEWTVPRAMWGDYLKGDAADNDLMKKAMSDGVITSFGSFAVLTHQEGEPTHGTWFSASSVSNLLKFLETLRNAPDATAPALAAAKHWDFVLESHDYAGHSGTFTNGYLRVGRWAPRPDSGDLEGLLKATMVPLLDKLVADGALHTYTIDRENIHTGNGPLGTIFLVIVANGPEGIDKFDASIDEAQKANPAAWSGLRAALDEKGHTDTLARVSVMSQK